MRHRIFIAINLPENIKKKLIDYQSNWPELPVRWTKKENLHITLAFLGYLADEELPEVLKITKEITQKFQPFTINLNKICYGPPKKIPPRPPKFPEIVTEEKEWEQKFGRPRMIWAKGEKSIELGRLQKDLENSLLDSEIKLSEEPGTRSHTPHITLGRIGQWEFRTIEPEERPIVDTDIFLSFEVNSIEIMESQLKRGGAEYITLMSAPLTSGKS